MDTTEFSIENYMKEYVPTVLATEGALVRLALELPEQASEIRQVVMGDEDHSLKGLAEALERYPAFLSLFKEEFLYVVGI